MSRLARAAEAATCDTLQQLGGGLVGMAAWALGAGQVKASLIGVTAGMASNLAYNYVCAPQDLGNAQPNSPQTGCSEFAEGSGFVWETNTGTGEEIRVDYLGRVTGLRLVTEYSGSNEQGAFSGGSFFVQSSNGGSFVDSGQNWETGGGLDFTWEMRADGNAVCGTPVTDGPQQPPPTEPYEYTDEESGCTLNVQFQGFIQPYEGGPVKPVFLMSGTEDQRASGGRMGGCNFEPTIVYEPDGGGGDGGGGDPIVIPVPVGGEPPRLPDGQPWWLPLLRGAIQGAAAAATQKLFDELFETVYPGDTYLLTGVCEEPDDQGNQPEFSRPVQGGNFYIAALSRLDAMQDLLQAHLGYKTPICGLPEDDEKPELFPYWRSISFESEDQTRNGRDRCRKLFRYRGATPGDLVGLANHWKNFSWSTGPVIVYHKGSAIGTPQVWASTVDEGKRVIRHACREAGLNPDQVGEWGVSGSNNPRYGVSHTVKLKAVDGVWKATARRGPSGTAAGALVCPDP